MDGSHGSRTPTTGVRTVRITEEAVKVWEEVSQTVRGMLDQAYRGIHPAEIETVKRVLDRVRGSGA